jgi:preprotein translocase SecE subunit
MADDNKKPRVRKAPQTFREAAEKQQTKAQKTRRRPVRKVAKATGKGVVTVTRPFSFLLWPFRLRPVRFVGRIAGRILWPRYLRNAFRELRQVTWPGRKETWKLTFAVFAFAIVFAAIISSVDYGLDKIFKRLIIK